jgi:hypothetical protein
LSTRRILVEGLGSVVVLKVIEASNVWENIDVRYVNSITAKGNYLMAKIITPIY